MDNRTLTLFILSITFFLTSCEENVLIDFSKTNTERLVVECELNVNKRVEAKIYSMSDFSDVSNMNYPTDLHVQLSTGTDVDLLMEYDPAKEVYFLDPIKHTLDANNTYKLTVNFKDNNVETLTATSKLPTSTKLSLVGETKILNIEENNVLENKKIVVPIALPNKSKSNSFYRLRVYRKIYKTVTSGGISNTIFTGKIEPLDVIASDEFPLVFHNPSYGERGCLIDASRILKNNFNLELKTKKFGEGDKLDVVYYEIESLTEPTYRYQISKSKQLNATLYGFSDPVISYTNIDNGQGFLGASATASDSIVLVK